ncbi:hypothetical protein [Rhodoferax ferrireducens]|uniref:hypothetical protein n=1 Tax=Rhodoferax ferrireducens TaxID=192843 RepID=UPI0013006848|nr:hypothetical protein [Rhodoferax ferrireducens]
MLLKPQDFLVALKLVAWGDQRWTYARLAHELGLSASEAHACIKRGIQAGLLLKNYDDAIAAHGDAAQPKFDEIHRTTGRVRRLRQSAAQQMAGAASSGTDNPARIHSRTLAEFAVYGAKYAFAADRTERTIGVATSHSAPAFAGVFAPGSEDYVWPHPNGPLWGTGVMPLHPSVPYAAMQDPKLYEMLALFDALRVGRARERGMALKRLPALINPDGFLPSLQAEPP